MWVLEDPWTICLKSNLRDSMTKDFSKTSCTPSYMTYTHADSSLPEAAYNAHPMYCMSPVQCSSAAWCHLFRPGGIVPAPA